jgi:hypothetical protein
MRNLGSSKNTLNATPKKMGGVNIMPVFNRPYIFYCN